MRKYLLLLSLAFTGLLLNAQVALKDNRYERLFSERSVVQQNPNRTVTPTHQHRAGSRSLNSILHSQPIGSAGNLLSIINGECNQLDVNDSLNAVTFIHRNDFTGAPGTNVAQYRFDVSKDRGASWNVNIGPITNDALIDNISINGRFPQAVIYNPAGNTNVDSAYLVYAGTWHNSPPSGGSGSWIGHMKGRGLLSGDTSTFSVWYPFANGGDPVNVASSFTQGEPGVFWNVNTDYTGTFATGSSAITEGVLIEKGVWNSTADSVEWTTQILPATFTEIDNAGTLQSIATSFNIAFDPTGQYGWIACLGDITPLADSVYQPVFWKSTDFGATWSAPIQVDLETVPGIMAELNPTLVNGDPASLNPSTTFQADLTVDVYGNPHLLTTIGSGEDYSTQLAGHGVYDITYYPNALAGCNWQGILLGQVLTFRGTRTNDNPAFTDDNRPLISRSPDGEKIFFFWSETDNAFVQSADNDIPNLFGRAIDIADGKITPLYNFTEGDSLWGGETSNTGGGVFGGAIYPTVSPTCLVNGNIYNVPLVMTQVDYLNFSQGQLGSSTEPAAFYYISNINFPASDFTDPLDQTPPTVTLNGPDTVSVRVNVDVYTEQGASAFDCQDGVINPTIVNSPDTSVIGIYEVLYIATDAAGNSDTVVRIVIVGDKPDVDFSWSFPQNACRAQFLDQTDNFPESWTWNFGDNTGSTQKNPAHTFPGDGTYNVCLTARNGFGTSTQVCKLVTISGCVSGINDLDFSQQISVFPNPTNGKVFVNIEGDNLPDFTVSVYNVLGETVVAPSNYKAGTTRIEMDLSSVSSGLYLVKIQSNRGSAVKHLTVTHK